MDNEKATFTDLVGREWTIRLDAPLVKRVKEICGIMLTDLRSDPFLKLSSDPILLVDVLWLLCEDQAKQRAITDQEFGKSISDEQIDSAASALVVAVANFCPTSRRSLLRSLLAKNEQMQTDAMRMALADLGENQEQMTAAMAKRTKNELKKLLDNIAEGS